MLSGRHLAVLAGFEADPHLLTAWIDGAIGRSCSAAGACAYWWHLFCLTLAVFALAILAMSVVPNGSLFRRSIVVALFALSPLVAGPLMDPLAVGSFVTIALFALAAGDIAEIYSLGPIQRGIVALALSLQDPLLAPAAIVYPLIARGSLRRIGAWAASAAAALGFAAHALIAHEYIFAPFAHGIDPIAGPLGITAVGVLLFVVVPIMVQLSRSHAFDALELSKKPPVRTVLLGAAALAAGLFATTGDPTPYWLGLESAAIICILPVTSSRLRFPKAANGILAVVLVFELVTAVSYERHVPGRVAAIESMTLRDVLNDARAPICLASDPSGDSHILADGAFIRLFDRTPQTVVRSNVLACLQSLPQTAEVATVRGLHVDRWGEILAAVRAAHEGELALHQLSDRGGTVSPRTHANTPNGLGAFGNVLQTPLGPTPDITILSGYHYIFACQPIPHAAHLTFAAATIPATPRLRFTVSARGNGRKAVGGGDVESQVGGSLSAWRYFSIPVPYGSCMTLDIEVTSPTDGVKGRWMTFAAMAVR